MPATHSDKIRKRIGCVCIAWPGQCIQMTPFPKVRLLTVFLYQGYCVYAGALYLIILAKIIYT